MCIGVGQGIATVFGTDDSLASCSEFGIPDFCGGTLHVVTRQERFGRTRNNSFYPPASAQKRTQLAAYRRRHRRGRRTFARPRLLRRNRLPVAPAVASAAREAAVDLCRRAHSRIWRRRTSRRSNRACGSRRRFRCTDSSDTTGGYYNPPGHGGTLNLYLPRGTARAAVAPVHPDYRGWEQPAQRDAESVRARLARAYPLREGRLCGGRLRTRWSQLGRRARGDARRRSTPSRHRARGS